MQAEIDELRAEIARLNMSADELRRACAETLKCDPDTWPDHGNAPLAIASALALRCVNLRDSEG